MENPQCDSCSYINEEKFSFIINIETGKQTFNSQEFLGEDDDSFEISNLVSELSPKDKTSDSFSEIVNLLIKKPNTFKNKIENPKRICLNGKVLTKNFVKLVRQNYYESTIL